MADRDVIIEEPTGQEPQPRSPGRRRALRVLAGAGLAATSFVAGRTTVPTTAVETRTATTTPKSPENILTTEPSVVSEKGWRVKYPEAKSNITYQNTPKTGEIRYFQIKVNPQQHLTVNEMVPITKP